MRVLGIDLGKRTGFGLLGGDEVLSGSLEVTENWAPLGAKMRRLGGILRKTITLHKPDIIAVATPFVRRGKKGAMRDTPQNLVPMFGQYTVLHMLADDMGIPIEALEEGEARRVLLGKFLPGKSDPIKRAIIQACRDRCWPCTDDHAGDALCMAAAVVERHSRHDKHETTPLFIAMPAKKRKPRRKKK